MLHRYLVIEPARRYDFRIYDSDIWWRLHNVEDAIGRSIGKEFVVVDCQLGAIIDQGNYSKDKKGFVIKAAPPYYSDHGRSAEMDAIIIAREHAEECPNCMAGQD